MFFLIILKYIFFNKLNKNIQEIILYLKFILFKKNINIIVVNFKINVTI